MIRRLCVVLVVVALAFLALVTGSLARSVWMCR